MDNVNHPKHYEGETSIECIDAMELILGSEGVVSFCLGNAIKYLWRHRHKNKEEDLDKAEWYMARAVKIKPEIEHTEKFRKLVNMKETAREEYYVRSKD